MQKVCKSFQKYAKLAIVCTSHLLTFFVSFVYRRMYVNGKKQMFAKPVQKNYSKLREKC